MITDRRAFFIVLVADGLIGLPSCVRAQQSRNKRVIAVLSLENVPSPGDSEPPLVPLRALGWVEGRNLDVVRRYASNRVEMLQPMAEELVRLDVEMIIANGTVASLAAKRVTRTIPILINRSADPVSAGLVASLARPGANVTGVSTMSAELQVKRLELLRELVPSATRFGVLLHPANPISRSTRKDMEQAFRARQLMPIVVEVSAASELDTAIAKVVQEGGRGLIVNADPLFGMNFDLIVRAADSRSLPLMIEVRDWLDRGALVSYGPDQDQLDHQLAVIIDKVLRGAKPADLPIEQPAKLNLTINLKSAKALGVSVPKAVQIRANEVIE